jgi:hypothetical protein
MKLDIQVHRAFLRAKSRGEQVDINGGKKNDTRTCAMKDCIYEILGSHGG